MRFDHLRGSAVCPVDKWQDRGPFLLVLLPRSMWERQAAAGRLCRSCRESLCQVLLSVEAHVC